MRIWTSLLALVVVLLSMTARADPLPATDKEFQACASDDKCKATCMNDKQCMIRLQKWLGDEMARLNAESDDLDKKAAEVSKPDAVPKLKEEKVPPAPEK